jgi:lysozyme family protein
MATKLSTVDTLIDAVIEREGKYVNNAADLGGPTRYGITQQVARSNGYAGDMKVLPRETAATIYRKQYWLAPRFSDVALRYPELATELFDIGVNMGIAVAGTFLQRCLNALNQRATLYPDVLADGGVGAVTLNALDNYRQRRGEAGGEVLLEAIQSLRGARYIEISEARPANEAFTYGWISRMVEMLKSRLARQ